MNFLRPNTLTATYVFVFQLAIVLFACVSALVNFVKTKVILNRMSKLYINHWPLHPRFLLWYPFAFLMNFLLFIPLVIMRKYINSSCVLLDTLWKIGIRLSSVTLTIVYFQMRKAMKEEKKKLESEGELRKLGNYSIGDQIKIGFLGPQTLDSYKDSHSEIDQVQMTKRISKVGTTTKRISNPPPSSFKTSLTSKGRTSGGNS